MRDEELARARVSKFDKQSSFQDMFEQRLQQMPGKREKVQITIHRRKFGDDVTVRSYVRTDAPGRCKWKRIPPLCPREVCPLLIPKGLRNH